MTLTSLDRAARRAWPARIAGAFAVLASLAGCASSDPEQGAQVTGRHRSPKGFVNNDIGTVTKSFADVLRLFSERDFFGPGQPPPQPTPMVQPELAALKANALAGTAMKPSATWIGHATVLVQAGGLNVLTDPMFSERASPVSFIGPKRQRPPGVALADLPHIDAVVVSHNHFDHLDRDSVRALAKQAGGPPVFLVPLGQAAWFADQGIAGAVELDWWQSHRIGAVEFFLTPVQHWSGRSLTDRNQTLWGGWAVFAPDFQWYFAGDTGWTGDFRRTRERFAERQTSAGFDLALIPIGAYEPNWFMQPQHVNPREAVALHQEVRARHSIAVHWGTFDLSSEALDQPPRDLAAARQAAGLPDDAFEALAIGQTRWLPPRPAP